MFINLFKTRIKNQILQLKKGGKNFFLKNYNINFVFGEYALLYFCIFQFINNSHIVANFLNKNWKIKIRKTWTSF